MNGGKFSPEIFRAYDIRGVFKVDFDEAFAQRLGERVVSAVKADVLVVGRDQRESSDELAYAVIDGAVHAGAKVIDVGELSSPQFYWAIRAFGAQGGIMVTASHLPGTSNGFKVIGRDGDVIGGERLRQVYDGTGRGHRPGGTIEYADAIPGYADAIAYAADWQGGRELRMAVQAPPSVIRVLERMGPIAPGADLAAQFDSDGDRVVLFERGREIPTEFVFLLLAERLEREPLVMDLRFSRSVRERLEKLGLRYTLSPVGRLALSDAMRRTGAALGAETSGHLYWKEFGGMEAPELAFLQVARVMESSRYSLADLVAPYRTYYKSEEAVVPLKDRKRAAQILETLAARFVGCRADRMDGITIDCWDARGWWCNVRPSNTEPLLRVIVEAKRKDLLERVLAEVLMLAGSDATR